MFLIVPDTNIKDNETLKEYHEEVYSYIVNNFALSLNLKEFKENMHHIMDSFKAYREMFLMLGFNEMVDITNYCMDILAEYIVPIGGAGNRYAHRVEGKYRTPQEASIKLFRKNTIKFLEEYKNEKES